MKKAVRFVIVFNALQVVTVLAILLYVLLHDVTDRFVEVAALVLAFLMVTWGAILDIREILNAEKIDEQARMLEEAYGQLEALNATLRKQRHDFMNHLQVVFSLIELGDYNEAMKYVESVYGDIQRTGGILKTAIPAVNALIAAKKQDCAEHGIALDTEIASGWKGLPVPGWEMCRVLGNLIDNARDALTEQPNQTDRRIVIAIDETPRLYTFAVSNNGPAIPEAIQRDIFQLGFTTKSDGHGSGLAIVREILASYGGEIAVESSEQNTRFTGSIPKRIAPPEETTAEKS